jgi:AraC-like DNA-binding protein
MKWITRERPKIDRIACPWLIKNFIDPAAVFYYVPFEQVLERAKELDAIPFDIPGVEFTHYKDKCTFDYFMEKYNIKDPALRTLSAIVRGADTDRHDLASQSSGLWAISAGLAHNFPNDHELLKRGMVLYDALYSWAKYLQKEKHVQQPFENLLLNVFTNWLKSQKSGGKKIPAWARELKEIIQDHIDTNITLKEISKNLEISSSYLSREFSKYFDDLSFGDYIRKQRIDKAKELMSNSSYSLTDIAYLTGFSDQSHFTRIFKKNTGQNPSQFRKKMQKSKSGTKG